MVLITWLFWIQMKFYIFHDFLRHNKSRFFATGPQTAPSPFSAGKSASWPFPTDILFRHLVHILHSIYHVFCTNFKCSDPDLPFSSNQTTFMLILFLWSAVIIHEGCYFYRDFLGLHQTRKDLVVCYLIRNMNFPEMPFFNFCVKRRMF